jgi:branched-chain amino acid transport system substrate-binding protein
MRKEFAYCLAATMVGLSVTSAVAQKKYDVGANDTEIRIGQTAPFSGPASAFSTIAKVEAAYIKMINDQGGVNGRKINLIQYDDSYSPPKTVEQVRKLVEGDEVLATFQLIGTPPNAAVQKYLNQKKVPHLLAASGANRFSDPANFPWTMGFPPSIKTEGQIYAHYILANYPNAKIGVFYQNDDLGKEYVQGLKDGLGDKATSMIAAEVSYETTEPTIDSQIVKLKSSGIDLLYSASTPKFAAQAIKKLADLGWKPVHIIVNSGSSISATIIPAGPENSKGVISATYFKDPLDPAWTDDPGMKKYMALMEKYYPEGQKINTSNAYGYSAAQLLVYILRKCGDDLTRENVLKQATSLKAVQLDLSLPGVSVDTSTTDYRFIKQFRMMQFDGQRWQGFGAIVDGGGS